MLTKSRTIAGKILLVEDDPLFGKLTARKLESELKATVIWVKTLAETNALLAQQRHHFIAAVLDFVLPDAFNGEIIEAVHKKGIPSIVFTSNISPEVREFIWSQKVVDYIPKEDPNSLAYLVETIKTLMSNNTNKVLLVEDSSFFRKALSKLLYIHQYQVVMTTNAEEALDIIKTHPDIKLVISDYNLPGMNGCELCIELRKIKKKGDLAIIGISSEDNKALAARFIKSGANDYIVKQSFILEEFYCRIRQCIENVDLFYQAKQAAAIDFLTGLYNRRYFFEKGERQFREARDTNCPMACIMLDIDYFKKVNDLHGHDVGDIVLTNLSGKLKAFAGDNDIVARLGGEEFCILTSRSPSEDQDSNIPFTYQISEQFNLLKTRIANSTVLYDEGKQSLKITVSMGISFNTFENFSQMLKSADEHLYFAKNNGRNQVVVSQA